MSLKKIISPVLALAIAAGSLMPLSSAANARDWNHRGARSGHAAPRAYNHGPRVNRWGDVRHNRWNNAGNNYNGGHRRHRDHTGRNIALGAFAAILGLAIAAETAKVQHDYYDND